jgi:peptidoglycan L-alanyl-D-glutamate endopeptidase CwlK
MKIVNAKLLSSVHPDLTKVFVRAAASLPFDVMVVQTERSPAEQKKNVAKGVSMTTHSRHVRKNNKNGLINAIDATPLMGRTIPWKRLDLFRAINDAMMKAAKELGIPIEWGGNWKTFKDMDHWQLPWAKYP